MRDWNCLQIWEYGIKSCVKQTNNLEKNNFTPSESNRICNFSERTFAMQN